MRKEGKRMTGRGWTDNDNGWMNKKDGQMRTMDK
jgi:hypothetical protein